jgi:catechol 2,3-dioxygenase-like lactoylglutathione lyase family enzyme
MDVDLGTFSVSLAVKDLQASMAFYAHLGFAPIAGEPENNWVILKNGDAKIGLFQGMFEDNLMTFNPTDARGIEAHLRAQGIEPVTATEGDSGPAHFVLQDPDGNTLLVDQHV